MQIEITSQYNITNWKADLKSVLLSAYTDQHAVLLLADSQVSIHIFNGEDWYHLNKLFIIG